MGYDYTGLFNNGVAQIPSFGGDGSNHEAALVFNPGGFEAGGASSGLYANKYMPSFSDNLTKVVGTHTVKAGFYYEWIRNAQPANNNTNGYLQVNDSTSTNPFTLGNEYADLVTGNLSSYSETNFNRINDISFSSTEFFVQDSWKVTKSLSIDYGMRFSHFTPWADRVGFGYSIFNLAAYNACSPAQQANAANYCGFRVAQAGSQRSAGRVPDAGSLLPAPVRHGLGRFRPGQDRAARRVGQELLPCRPVHQRPGCVRRASSLTASQPAEHRQPTFLVKNLWPRSA